MLSKIFAKVVVRNLEKLALGIVEEIENVGTVFVGVADDFATDADQFPLDELLQDDARMCFNIGRRHDGIRETGHVVGTTDEVELFTRFQLFYNRKDVDRLVFLLQALHRAVNSLMRVGIKTFGLEYFDDGVKCALFEHDGAKNGFLEVLGLGRNLTVNHRAEVRGRFSPGFPVLI
jgi:hypothetical protein